MDNAVGHRARSSAGLPFSMLDGSVDFLKMLCGPACAVPGNTFIKSVATDAISNKVDELGIELLQ